MELGNFITSTDKKLLSEKYRVTVRYIEMVLKGTRSDGGSLAVNDKNEEILNTAWLLVLENSTHLEAKRQLLGLPISQTTQTATV